MEIEIEIEIDVDVCRRGTVKREGWALPSLTCLRLLRVQVQVQVQVQVPGGRKWD